MKISTGLHVLVARKKRKDFNKRLNCSIVNVLFFKRSGKEFHTAGPVQEKARLPYVHTSQSTSCTAARRCSDDYEVRVHNADSEEDRHGSG